MSRPSDVNVLLYDSESALSRDSLDIGNDNDFSSRSSGVATPSASQPAPNNAHIGSSAYQPAPNAAHYGQVASPTIASADKSAGRKTKAKISWWWWWEIGGSLLSIICVGLVLVVLFEANDRALAAWPLWIQPNSLIAVFTTVGKSAMMVPIASCISQLKWRHFELRANRLSHLQLLDEASRGPWGSLMLLSDVRIKAYTARALAIVSLVSLGFDPSAQQILEFPTRETRLTNASASIGVASSYASKAFVEDTDGSTGREFSPHVGNGWKESESVRKGNQETDQVNLQHEQGLIWLSSGAKTSLNFNPQSLMASLDQSSNQHTHALGIIALGLASPLSEYAATS